MKSTIYRIVLLSTFFLAACSATETSSSYFINRFKKDQSDLDRLLIELRNSDLVDIRNDLKIFRPSDFSSEIKEHLVRLGITELHFYPTGCNNGSGLEIDLTTNWTAAFPVHLSQSLCKEDINTDKAYFKRDNGNEGWGVGDNCVIWFEYTSTKGVSTYYDKQTDTLNHNHLSTK